MSQQPSDSTSCASITKDKAAPHLLEIQSLHVGYHTADGIVRILCDVSLAIDSGEMLALVGETGCGKTTLALSLTGLLDRRAHMGAVRMSFDGRNLENAGTREWRSIRGKKIGMIFQDPRAALNPVMTVGQHLLEAFRTHQKTSRQATLEGALNLLSDVGLAEPSFIMRRFPFELSGGQCQRVCIALAICGRPRLLIADEPTSALDTTVQAQILELLQQMRERHGLALLFISHDLALVHHHAGRVAVMYHGRLVESGKVDEIFTRPAHPYTQALMECRPTLQHQRDKQPLYPIWGNPPHAGGNPPGCAFAPRCRKAERECAHILPEKLPLSATHWAACIQAGQGET